MKTLKFSSAIARGRPARLRADTPLIQDAGHQALGRVTIAAIVEPVPPDA